VAPRHGRAATKAVTGEVLFGQALANLNREGLADFTKSSGRHSFAFTPPPGLELVPDAVEVRRSLDGVALRFSPQARQLRERVA
jgi:hypothetical protein